MRVLLSCLQSRKRHPLPAYGFWREYFVEGCREAGIECIEVPEVDWVEGLVHPHGDAYRAWRERTWQAALDFARREHARRPIDFFLGYLYPAQIEPQAILDLQQLGIPCVNFFCDNVREFRRVPPQYQPFALHWVPEAEALPLYRQANLPHLHAPMPCWVPLELRRVPAMETEPPTFIGSADILRRHLLGEALRAGADLIVRGPGWSAASDAGADAPATQEGPRRSARTILSNQWDVLRLHGAGALLRKLENRLKPLAQPPVPAARIRPAVFGAEYLRITRQALVTIGVNRVPTSRASNHRPLSYSRLRDLEAPMLGACYLTEWTAGLGELYELGTEIETYRTPEELAAKVDELKADPARRRRMRERAQRRALEEHSTARTLQRVARQVIRARAFA
jgi:hypothetical protein